MSQHAEAGKAFAGWAEENSGLAVDENFEYTDRTVGNFAAASFAAGAEWQSQREPTEAEINAAAKALCERWHPGEWDTGFETADDDYRRDAEAMLLAARKAVTE